MLLLQMWLILNDVSNTWRLPPQTPPLLATIYVFDDLRPPAHHSRTTQQQQRTEDTVLENSLGHHLGSRCLLLFRVFTRDVCVDLFVNSLNEIILFICSPTSRHRRPPPHLRCCCCLFCFSLDSHRRLLMLLLSWREKWTAASVVQLPPTDYYYY